MKKQLPVKLDEQNPEPFELIASSIIEISAAFKKMNQSKLKPRVVLLLLKDMTGLGMGDIEKVITAASMLEKEYLKPEPKKP
jgi:hypothetical protein